MNPDLDTLATALYVKVDDLLLAYPQWAPQRPAVGIINEVFTPTPEEVAHHRTILEMFEKAEAEGTASVGADGRMIDYAVARTARSLLARAAVAQRRT